MEAAIVGDVEREGGRDDLEPDTEDRGVVIPVDGEESEENIEWPSRDTDENEEFECVAQVLVDGTTTLQARDPLEVAIDNLGVLVGV